MKEQVLLLVGAFGCLFTAVNPLSAQIWIPTSAPTNLWTSVASSADGSKLVAAVYGGGIYTSTNSGATWAPTSAPGGSLWTCVASSADGSQLVAALDGFGIYTSTNSGATWTQASAPGSYVASSSDGSRLVAADALGAWSGIYTSTNSGATWTLTSASGSNWTCVASSADGSKLVAATDGSGIYTSTNSGTTWTLTSAPNWPRWNCVASSAGGTRLAATGSPLSNNVYISTDSGATWNACSGGIPFPIFPMGEDPYGYAVCLSADGTKLAVAENIYDINSRAFGYGLIYTSTNSGATWGSGYKSGYQQYWSSVASSADGNKLVAAVYGGGIYTSQTTPAPVLNIAPSSNNLVLSWILPSTNFVLQQNSDLTAMNWEDVTNPPALNLANLQNQVALPLPAGNAFYRLKTP